MLKNILIKNKNLCLLFVIFWSLASFANRPLYTSKDGLELEVKFHARLLIPLTIEEVKGIGENEKESYLERHLQPTLKYLFGPLTHNQLGSPQRNHSVKVDWNSAVKKGNLTEVPYEYRGKWILNRLRIDRNNLQVPLPFNEETVFSPRWKQCTDSAPDHQTRSFFWYYWDPNRYGCDHIAGVQFQMVKVQILSETPILQKSFPEYPRLIVDQNGKKKLQMTFAFGYADEHNKKNPLKDYDIGASEFRAFLSFMRSDLEGFSESPLYLSEYPEHSNDESLVGFQYSKMVDEVQVVVRVVVNFRIDQMELFAKSFASDHDGLFAWFGHSRVGSGFDADQFVSMLKYSPELYSISPRYQVIYWGGCNSYSYYTLPFFKLKATPSDPSGIKNLDIVANGLPSYFHLNSQNAQIAARAFLDFDRKHSYQEIIEQIEKEARNSGISVLAAVLGDEDNPTLHE
ncbi:MAG: hypothetical protein AB7O96_12320 [Pseudobdellovibrionaceae bacterium]